jgi:hypothetical protein
VKIDSLQVFKFNIMKKLILLTLIALTSIYSQSQCTNGSAFGTATAPASGTVTISTCSFQSEYSTINSVAASTIYNCAIATGGYITIHQGTPAGPVVGFGTSPLQWTSTVAGTYYAHWNTNAACGLASSCVTTTITYVSPAAACTNPAVAGTTVSSVTNACPSAPFNLTLSGASIASGLFYQWQSSPDGITYTNIATATNSSYSATQSDTTYYQCIVTCGAGTPVTSTPVVVNMNPFYNCYCTSNATTTADEEIINVTVGTMNNSSTCSQTGGPGSIMNQYSDYTTLVAPPVLAATAGYNFSVGVGTCGGNFNSMTKIFIDYNQNGLFTDPGEQVYVTPTFTLGAHTVTGSFIVPATATVGITRMRVVNTETTVATSVNPCGTYGYGETEDYLVNIAPIPTCPQPTSFAVISADLTTADLDWTAGGAETTWQVQYGPTGFALGTGTTVTVTPNSNTTLTGLTPNSFYQAYVRGICGPGDTSYWAGSVSWNTYGLGIYMEADNACPTSDFVDISTSGTLYALATGASVALPVPFPILYQGVLYTTATLGNAGAILLGTSTGTISSFNSAIGAATATGLYPFWDAMQTSGAGVWVDTVGTAPNRQFIVQWTKDNNVLNSNNTMNFELIIDEATMEIYFVYDDVNNGNALYNNGLSATIGVAGTAQDIQVSFNNASYLTNNSCAHFYYTDCPKPTAFTISYITQDEVAFTWSAGLAAETNWTVIYGPDGFDPATGGTTITTTTAAATLPGLTQLTQYDVYIFADCNTTLQSNGLSGTFLTLPYCSNPGGMTNTTDVDSIYTAWTWTESSPAYPSTGFNIAYGMSGFNPYTQGTEVNADNNFTDTIANSALLGGGVYQVYVQAVCGTDTSQYIGPFAVTMPLSNDTVCGAEMLMANGTVYTFNNTGATVQTGETAIAPPATGAQTTTGWINSSLNNTTWFKFVAPASGNVRVNNTAINYAGQAAVYESSGCSNFANFTLLAANDNAIGSSSVAPNFTVCGLTPGVEYYLMHDGSTATVGNYSISITPIVLNAGSFVTMLDVCAGDTVNLFNGITGQDAGGLWTAELASAGTGISDSLFASAGLAFQIFNFEYRLTDGCAYDSIVSQVEIYGPSSAGTDGTLTVCRNEPIDLLAGLSGNVDFGGSWYNPSNQLMSNSEIIASNIPGQFNYDYITGNGVCPDDTANVLLNVDPSCNYLDVTEMYFGSISMYPNPTNGVLNITNSGSTEVFNYEVTDVEGRVIATKIAAINGVSTTEVNLSGKETGVYMIRVYNDNAEKIFRVVLQ